MGAKIKQQYFLNRSELRYVLVKIKKNTGQRLHSQDTLSLVFEPE